MYQRVIYYHIIYYYYVIYYYIIVLTCYNIYLTGYHGTTRDVKKTTMVRQNYDAKHFYRLFVWYLYKKYCKCLSNFIVIFRMYLTSN